LFGVTGSGVAPGTTRASFRMLPSTPGPEVGVHEASTTPLRVIVGAAPTASDAPWQVQVITSPARAGKVLASPPRVTVATQSAVEGSATAETPAGIVSVIVMGDAVVLTEIDGPRLLGASSQLIAEPALGAAVLTVFAIA